MATGLVLPTTLPTSWSTAQSQQFWIGDLHRQVHARLLVGRPDGYTWADLTSHLVRAEVELGDVSGVGTGGTGADAVVRRMTFTIQPEGMLIPAWPDTTAQDEEYVVGDESDVVGDEQDSAALLIDRLFGTTHKYARDGFSPRDMDSAWNRFKGEFAPIVKPNREVALLAAVTPPGEQPSALDWVTLFHGSIDKTSTPGSDVTVSCRDLAKRLMYTYIYEQEEFGDDDNPVPAHIVIQQILDRYIKTATPQLYAPQVPTFTCGRFRTQYESVWDAIQKVAAQFGWFLGYRWVPSVGAFRLVLMEPPRLKNANSADFRLTHVKNIYDHTDEIGDEHIGNVAVVRFIEKATGERKTVIVRNQESIDEWEERAMEFSEGELSLIDTEEEGTALGIAAVTDCGGIIGAKRVIVPFLPTADVFTGAVIADPRISSTEDFMGVVSVRHVLDFNAKVFETEMIGQSRVVGGDRRWRKMQTRPGLSAPRAPEDIAGGNKVMPKPVGVTARGIIRGVAIDVPIPPVNANRWAETEIHLSTTENFTPSDATRVDGGRKTHFELTDDGANALVAGAKYYLKVRYRDNERGAGAYSDQVSAVAGSVGGADINAILLYSVADDLSGQVINPGIWMLNAEGDSYTDDAGDATSLNASPGDRISIEAYRSSFLFRGIFEQIARWAVSESGLDTVLENTEFIVGTQGAPGIYPVTAPSAHIVKGTNLRTLKFRTRFGTIDWEETDNIPVEGLGWAEGFLVSRIRYEPSTIKLFINDTLVATHASSPNWNGVPFVEVRNTGSNFSSIYLDYFIQMYV